MASKPRKGDTVDVSVFCTYLGTEWVDGDRLAKVRFNDGYDNGPVLYVAPSAITKTFARSTAKRKNKRKEATDGNV